MRDSVSAGFSQTPSPATGLRLALSFSILIVLSGCAGAKLERVALAPQQPVRPPQEILVDVHVAPDVQSMPSTQALASTLQADLVKRYKKAGIPAAGGADGAADVAVLHVNITQADPGSRLERFLIGFGAGRSSLRTEATLDLADQDAHAISLVTAAKSRRRPGIILPGSVAALTGNLIPLAVGGGIRLVSVARSTFGREADHSAKLIVEQTLGLYRKAGWPLPNAASQNIASVTQG